MTDFLTNRTEFLHYVNRFCPCKEKKLYVYFKDSIGQSFFFATLILEWCLEPMTFIWILSIVTKLLSSECILLVKIKSIQSQVQGLQVHVHTGWYNLGLKRRCSSGVNYPDFPVLALLLISCPPPSSPIVMSLLVFIIIEECDIS